jgi:hypothetical protein
MLQLTFDFYRFFDIKCFRNPVLQLTLSSDHSFKDAKFISIPTIANQLVSRHTVSFDSGSFGNRTAMLNNVTCLARLYGSFQQADSDNAFGSIESPTVDVLIASGKFSFATIAQLCSADGISLVVVSKCDVANFIHFALVISPTESTYCNIPLSHALLQDNGIEIANAFLQKLSNAFAYLQEMIYKGISSYYTIGPDNRWTMTCLRMDHNTFFNPHTHFLPGNMLSLTMLKHYELHEPLLFQNLLLKSRKLNYLFGETGYQALLQEYKTKTRSKQNEITIMEYIIGAITLPVRGCLYCTDKTDICIPNDNDYNQQMKYILRSYDQQMKTNPNVIFIEDMNMKQAQHFDPTPTSSNAAATTTTTTTTTHNAMTSSNVAPTSAIVSRIDHHTYSKDTKKHVSSTLSVWTPDPIRTKHLACKISKDVMAAASRSTSRSTSRAVSRAVSRQWSKATITSQHDYQPDISIHCSSGATPSTKVKEVKENGSVIKDIHIKHKIKYGEQIEGAFDGPRPWMTGDDCETLVMQCIVLLWSLSQLFGNTNSDRYTDSAMGNQTGEACGQQPSRAVQQCDAASAASWYLSQYTPVFLNVSINMFPGWKPETRIEVEDGVDSTSNYGAKFEPNSEKYRNKLLDMHATGWMVCKNVLDMLVRRGFELMAYLRVNHENNIPLQDWEPFQTSLYSEESQRNYVIEGTDFSRCWGSSITSLRTTTTDTKDNVTIIQEPDMYIEFISDFSFGVKTASLFKYREPQKPGYDWSFYHEAVSGHSYHALEKQSCGEFVFIWCPKDKPTQFKRAVDFKYIMDPFLLSKDFPILLACLPVLPALNKQDWSMINTVLEHEPAFRPLQSPTYIDLKENENNIENTKDIDVWPLFIRERDWELAKDDLLNWLEKKKKKYKLVKKPERHEFSQDAYYIVIYITLVNHTKKN